MQRAFRSDSGRLSHYGRGDWIRTSDHLHPMQVRYQAAPRPERGSTPRVGKTSRFSLGAVPGWFNQNLRQGARPTLNELSTPTGLAEPVFTPSSIWSVLGAMLQPLLETDDLFAQFGERGARNRGSRHVEGCLQRIFGVALPRRIRRGKTDRKGWLVMRERALFGSRFIFGR